MNEEQVQAEKNILEQNTENQTLSEIVEMSLDIHEYFNASSWLSIDDWWALNQ